VGWCSSPFAAEKLSWDQLKAKKARRRQFVPFRGPCQGKGERFSRVDNRLLRELDIFFSMLRCYHAGRP